MTAASSRAATGNTTAGVDLQLGLATQGKFVNLKGGLPIIADGQVIGGIGVGSGTGEQDLECAAAGIAALG